MSSTIEVDDAIVLILGVAGGRSPAGSLTGITRLEKLVFLLDKEQSTEGVLTEDPEFVAYNFGPFSKKVYQAVDMLAAAQLITDSQRSATTDDDTWEQREILYDSDEGGLDGSSSKYVNRSFSLTPRGWRYFRALEDELEPAEARGVARLKERFGGLTLRELIRYVYLQYPDYASKSLIAEEVYAEARRQNDQPERFS